MTRQGRARLVPICFAIDGRPDSLVLYSPLDEKPESVLDPRTLGRVRDIAANPQVSLLVDRWSEDWSQLAWLRLEGQADVLEPGAAEHPHATELLRERYAQYADQVLGDRPLIRITIDRATSWSASQ